MEKKKNKVDAGNLGGMLLAAMMGAAALRSLEATHETSVKTPNPPCTCPHHKDGICTLPENAICRHECHGKF